MIFVFQPGVAEAKRKEPRWPKPQPEEFIPFRFQKGKALIREQKWAEAQKVFEQILDQKPNYLAASLELARVHFHQKRRREALDQLKIQLRRQRGTSRQTVLRRIHVLSQTFFNKENFKKYQDARNLLNSKKWKQSLGGFEEVATLEPANIDVLVRYSQSLILNERYREAINVLERARKINPYEDEISLWMGRALYKSGEVGASLKELAKANQSLARSELAPIWLADAFVASGSTSRAVQVLKEDIKKEPLHLLSLIELAKLEFPEKQTNVKPLWKSRKSLQLAMSRYGRYAHVRLGLKESFESDLGLSLFEPEEIKTRIESLLSDIDSRLGVSSS